MSLRVMHHVLLRWMNINITSRVMTWAENVHADKLTETLQRTGRVSLTLNPNPNRITLNLIAIVQVRSSVVSGSLGKCWRPHQNVIYLD